MLYGKEECRALSEGVIRHRYTGTGPIHTHHVISGTTARFGDRTRPPVDDNDDELTLHPRCTPIKLHTGRPGASARRRCFCLLARSLSLTDTLQTSSQLTWRIRPGQISASLAGMSRTIDDYDSMARREIIKAKQEKATSYVLAVPPHDQRLTSPVTTDECKSSKATMLNLGKSLSGLKKR